MNQSDPKHVRKYDGHTPLNYFKDKKVEFASHKTKSSREIKPFGEYAMIKRNTACVKGYKKKPSRNFNFLTFDKDNPSTINFYELAFREEAKPESRGSASVESSEPC